MIAANKRDNFFILSGFLIVLLLGYFQMSYKPVLVSLIFTISFLWLFIWFILHLFSYKQSRNIFNVLLCSFISSLHVILLSPSYVSFDYYNKLIMFICFLLFIYLCSSIRVNKKIVVYILIINVLLSLLYIYFYKFGVQFDLWNYLTLNFTNPNLTGIFLSYSFMYVFLILTSRKELKYGKYSFCVVVFLAVTLVLLTFLTGSRGAILTELCYVGFILIDKLMQGKLVAKKWIICIWSIVPMLFVIFYTAKQGDFGVGSMLVDEEQGKSSSTRMIVWGPALDIVEENIVFGDYCGISNGTGKSQMHNTHLDVIASYGLIPFLLFVLVLYKAVYSSSKNIYTNFNKYSLWAFMTCFVSGIFEAVLVAGGLCVYILACGFLLLANSDIKQK